MELNQHFQKFDEALTLDETRAGRARAAHGALQGFLESDGPVTRYLYETFLQGSYAQDTIVRPRQDTDEFDVDVVVALNVEAMPADRRTPDAVVRWLKNRLVSSENYKGRVRQRARCIRIDFVGEFHLDVVAAHGDSTAGGPLYVPDRELGEWVPSHPKGLTAWVNAQHRISEQRFKRTVKMLKYWRNEKVGTDSAPKSIVLQTLIGHQLPKTTPSDAHAVVVVLQNLWDLLGPIKLVPAVRNPAVEEENLARDWTQLGFERFKDHLERAARRARSALDESDKEKSIRSWRELFGERFPASA